MIEEKAKGKPVLEELSFDPKVSIENIVTHKIQRWQEHMEVRE